MKIAVIDCGSNTFNLLIAEADQFGWKAVFKNKLPVKIGAGGYRTGRITEDRFVRGIDAFLSHAQNLRNFGCEYVFAFATSAIRDAANGKEFIEKIFEITGVRIDIIDGDRESELTYKGILQTIIPGEHPIMVMDIGGGSTEFIVADKSGILWEKSFRLGVSRIFDLFNLSDPLTREEITRLRETLFYELQPLKDALYRYTPKWLVGSSGSFDTILDLYFEGQKIPLSAIEKSNEIAIGAFPQIYEWIIKSTFKQRVMHPVIPLIRAEYMPVAVILIKVVLELYPFERLIHSSYSLKEGAMKEIIERIEWRTDIDAQNEKPEDYLEG